MPWVVVNGRDYLSLSLQFATIPSQNGRKLRPFGGVRMLMAAIRVERAGVAMDSGVEVEAYAGSAGGASPPSI